MLDDQERPLSTPEKFIFKAPDLSNLNWEEEIITKLGPDIHQTTSSASLEIEGIKQQCTLRAERKAFIQESENELLSLLYKYDIHGQAEKPLLMAWIQYQLHEDSEGRFYSASSYVERLDKPQRILPDKFAAHFFEQMLNFIAKNHLAHSVVHTVERAPKNDNFNEWDDSFGKIVEQKHREYESDYTDEGWKYWRKIHTFDEM